LRAAVTATCSIPKFSPIICGMKKPNPSRARDKWQHALTRPLTHRTPYETIELIRGDLFELLDLLTTNIFNHPASWASNDAEIQRVADRLKELTPYRDRAARAALKAGRIDYAINIAPDDDDRSPGCGPFSTKGWEELHRQWERAH
jgi:hypothetical protein